MIGLVTKTGRDHTVVASGLNSSGTIAALLAKDVRTKILHENLDTDYVFTLIKLS